MVAPRTSQATLSTIDGLIAYSPAATSALMSSMGGPVIHARSDSSVESIIGDWFAPALERALHAVFHRVDMQVQLIGGGFETGPGVQELSQCFTHAFVAIRRGR